MFLILLAVGAIVVPAFFLTVCDEEERTDPEIMHRRVRKAPEEEIPVVEFKKRVPIERISVETREFGNRFSNVAGG